MLAGRRLGQVRLVEVLHGLAPSERGEFEITDVLNEYIRRGSLTSYRYEDEWHDAGTVQSLLASGALAASFATELPTATDSRREEVAAEEVDPNQVRP